MAIRKKVKLAFIDSQAKRKNCYKKRCNNLIKKVQELSILCGVQVFVIIYNLDKPGFVVWPTNEWEANQVILRYTNMPEIEQSRSMLDQRSYLEGVIKKLENKKKAQQKRISELELACLMDEAHNGNELQEMDIHGVTTLSLLLKDRLRALKDKADKWEIKTGHESAIAQALMS